MKEDLLSTTMYPKKSTAVWLLLGGIGFTVAGIWVGSFKGWIGYAIAAFFSLCIPVAIVQLIPGSSYLRLDSEGFTFCSMFRKTHVPWSVVQEFFVISLRQTGVKVHDMVGFNFVSSYDKTRFGRSVAHALTEAEGGLPDTYGRKAHELAAIMNRCLARFREGRGEQSAALDRNSVALYPDQ